MSPRAVPVMMQHSVMAAVDQGEGSYALEEEIELLEAIYIHELTIEGPRQRPSSISVLLHPSTGDEEHKRFVCLTLVICLPDKYPSILPSICIKSPRGLSDAHTESILSNLRELAESCLGRPMLYELIEYAKESLTDNNIPSCPCAICLCHFQDSHEFTKTECYHYFHCGCLARFIEFSHHQEDTNEDNTQVECPMCRLPINYDLAELKKFASDELNDEEVMYKPTEDMRKLQKKMSSLFEKQKRKGGIIDVEQERNKFLIDITSVRQEEIVPECELPIGPETEVVEKEPTTIDPAYNEPKQGSKEPDDRVRKDKHEKVDKRGKKELPRNSRWSRGSRRPPSGASRGSPSGTSRGSPSDKRGGQSYRERPRNVEPRTSETQVSEKSDATKGFEQNDMENPAAGNSRRHKHFEQRKPEKRAAKESEVTENGFTFSADKKHEDVQKTDKEHKELDHKPSVLDSMAGNTGKDFDTNGTASRTSNDDRPRSARRSRGKGRGKSSVGNKKETCQKETRQGIKESGKASSTNEMVDKHSEDVEDSDMKNECVEDLRVREQSPNEQGQVERDRTVRPPPGFEKVISVKGGCEHSTKAPRPPPGFVKRSSPSPRPPPGLGNPAEDAGRTFNQSEVNT